MPRALLALVLCLIGPLSIQAGTSNSPDFSIAGWREVLVSVSSIQAQQQFFESTAAWEVRYSGKLGEAQLSSWQLAPQAKGRERLLANPGSSTGFIRLVEFSGVQQRLIRSSHQSWDSGGIFDINIRVANMDKKFSELQGLGWQGFSDPVSFSFGPFAVTEWIVTGPDGLCFALIERNKPVLEGWPHLKEFSRAFNSTQVVADMEASLHFYRDILGFKKYLYHQGSSDKAGMNVLGLPPSLATRISREVWVLHPQGLNEGSIELLAFEDLPGRDFSTYADPPNLGILMLRFPVKGIEQLADHLEQHQVKIISGPDTLQMPPYGQVKRLAIKAPEGTWLEFFEEQ